MVKIRKYYWDMYQIQNKIKILEELLLKETNHQRRSLIQDDIILLKNFIDETEEEKLPSKTPKLLDCYQYIKEYLNESTFFWSEFRKFSEILDDAFSDDYIENLQIPRMTLSKDDILSLTHDFYKNLNPFIFKIFMKHFYRRFNHTNITSSSIDNCSGFSLCLSNRDESYIKIVKENTIEDVITSIHEYEHSISSSINYNHIRNRLFIEFDTQFIELIAQDYLKSITNNKGIPILRYNDLVKRFLESNDICDLISLISAEKEQKTPFTSNKMLKDVALNKCNIDPDDVSLLLYENSDDLTSDNYLLGYLLAVELYKIYKDDKDKALHLLKKIILLDNNSNEQYYSNIKRLGLVPNLSVHQFQNDTKNELKRALKKNPKNIK